MLVLPETGVDLIQEMTAYNQESTRKHQKPEVQEPNFDFLHQFNGI